MTEAPDPGITEHHLEVRRTARYATLGSMAEGVDEVWYACHGYRQLARRFLLSLRALADPARLVVAPEGLSRFYLDPAEKRHGPGDPVGATWMTREDREAEIRDYVAYLDDLAEGLEGKLGPRPLRRVVLGFSQGVHTAARWVVLGWRPPPTELVLWGAYLPPDLDLDRAARRLDGVILTLVRGTEDRYADETRAREEAERLEAAGIRYRELTFPGGHEIRDEVLEELRTPPRT